MVETKAILNHYSISHPFPTEWPAEKDQEDEDEQDEESRPEPAPKPEQKPPVPKKNPKSRYTVLEYGTSQRRSLVPGAEKTRDGVENLVQRDEFDALGFTDSVVKDLRRKGLTVDEDERLRNRFLLSSTTFNPALYLSQVHSGASNRDLIQGLEFLSRSIDQKSASLKVLVESNFERFVKAKSVIDNVYTEMRNQGAEPETPKSRPHSRHVSRSSLHYRQFSNQSNPLSGKSAPPGSSDRKKHALLKESDYGVQGIKTPLIEVAVKAEEVWGPTLGGRERENNLRSILSSVEGSQKMLDVSNKIAETIKRKDFHGLVREYTKARDYVDAARTITEKASRQDVQLIDAEIHTIVITARMWLDVEAQIDNFKRSIWRDLTSVQANLTMSTDRSHQEDHVALISVLLELGVEDNPIWVWLLSRYDYLKNKINSTFERSRVEIEVVRRRLAHSEKPSLYASAVYFRAPTRTNPDDQAKHLDSEPNLDMWELILHSMGNLLSMKGGVLGEVIDFWAKAQSFIDGKAQKTLPTGIDGSSKRHHRLSTDGVKDLQSGAMELVDLLREHIYSFFADPPIEDVSSLFSPLPGESPKTPYSATMAPFAKPESRFNADLLSPPPPSPKKGEAWEEFAFWPPYANSLSGVHYLGRILILIAVAATEMSMLQPVASSGNASTEKLRVLVNVTRERAARATCAAWNEDALTIKVLEDWTRGPDGARDATRMPSGFTAFETFVLSGLQKILYVPDAVGAKHGPHEIVSPPPNKLLQMVRSQFVTSLYKALSGMVENAERPVNVTQNPWAANRDSAHAAPGPAAAPAAATDRSRDAVDASSRNLRMLLTLANLATLRATVVPQLIAQCEADFSTSLAAEAQTVTDVLAQIDTRLFQSYVRAPREHLSALLSGGIATASWPPRSPQPQPSSVRPTTVGPYIHSALLHLVAVHAEVSATAPPLVAPVLAHLFEHLVHALLEAFRARAKLLTSGKGGGGGGRARFDAYALMQATLDTEFAVQTLAPYATARAQELQSAVYAELDRHTEPEAQARLSRELPEMRGVLKRLREATRGEFACFRKEKKGKGGGERT